MALLTATQWGYRWGNDVAGLIDNVSKEIPIFQDILWRPAGEGNTHKFARVTAYPVPTFRAAGAGAYEGHTTVAQVSVTVKILQSWASVDKALSDWAEVLADEAEFQFLGVANTFENEVFYGDTDADANGFDGITDSLVFSADNCLGAGGTGDDTTSIFFISHGKRRFEGIYGTNGLLGMGDAYTNKRKTDGADTFLEEVTMLTNMYPAIAMYRTSDAIGQICNIEHAGASNLITLALIDEMALWMKGENKVGYLHKKTWLKIKALLAAAGYDTGTGSDDSGKWNGSYSGFRFKVSDNIILTETAKS